MTNPVDRFIPGFSNPPASSRPIPFMVWNGVVTRSFITETLEALHQRGCGGVFVHPRPGLVTEYLSQDWFDLFRFCADECKRLGLECHIYDENSFPAGFAGGHVPATNPHTAAAGLHGQLFSTPPQHSGDFIAAYWLDSAHPTPAPRDTWHQTSPQKPLLLITLQRSPGDNWQGGFPYVDLTLPETTTTFLATTHDQYAKHVGETFSRAGGPVQYVFSDEPMLARGGSDLPFSRHLQAEFRRQHGYDILAKLHDLLSPTDAGRAVRFDYNLTVQRLFETNFAIPMAQWCARHNLLWTGHFMEHEWPSPASHPSAMALLRHMQVPGNDLLGFQFHADKPPASNSLWWLNLVELRSVVAQTNAPRAMCETTGGGGYAYTLRDIKSCEDFALAGGVTLVNPHLCHQTLTGARRYDWGHTISHHAPWFDAYRTQADHVGRVQHALLAGKPTARILLLHSTTTAWLDHLPRSLLTPHFPKPDPEPLRQSQSSLVRLLSQAALDFDLGDEMMLRDSGHTANAKLILDHARYDVVVIPEGMANLLPSTLTLLENFANAGGHVLKLRDSADFIAGRRTTTPLPGRLLTDRGELVRHLRQLCPPHLDPDSTALPDTALHIRRQLPDGTAVHFLANPYLTPTTVSGTIEGTGLHLLDTASGQPSPLPTERNGNRQRFSILLPPRGHALLLTSAQPAPPAAIAPTRKPATLALASVRRAEVNLLVLDYCDVTSSGGASARSVPAIHAEQLVWRDHGFDRNPWRWAIQYRRTCLDAAFPTPSGFTLSYRFHVRDSAVLPSLRVAVERPELYRMTLNDRPIPFPSGTPFFDQHMAAFPVGTLARTGENTLTLHAQTMHALCEITPAYILGDFAALPSQLGFELAAPVPLSPGQLIPQGLPFYNRGVLLEYQLTLPSPSRTLELTLPDWLGSVVGVAVAGRHLGWITTSPGRLVANVDLTAGTHALTLDLRGHLKNQVGPWHSAPERLPIPWAWEEAPASQPPGDAYRLEPIGILSPPTVSAC
jgi:hypothetical protein